MAERSAVKKVANRAARAAGVTLVVVSCGPGSAGEKPPVKLGSLHTEPKVQTEADDGVIFPLKVRHRYTQGPHSSILGSDGVKDAIDLAPEDPISCDEAKSTGKKIVYTKSPLVSPISGTVTVKGKDDPNDRNHSLIEIQRRDGIRVRLVHVSQFKDGIVEGKKVNKGDEIGFMGCDYPPEGDTNATHVHVGVADRSGASISIMALDPEISKYRFDKEGNLVDPYGRVVRPVQGDNGDNVIDPDPKPRSLPQLTPVLANPAPNPTSTPIPQVVVIEAKKVEVTPTQVLITSTPRPTLVPNTPTPVAIAGNRQEFEARENILNLFLSSFSKLQNRDPDLIPSFKANEYSGSLSMGIKDWGKNNQGEPFKARDILNNSVTKENNLIRFSWDRRRLVFCNYVPSHSWWSVTMGEGELAGINVNLVERLPINSAEERNGILWRGVIRINYDYRYKGANIGTIIMNGRSGCPVKDISSQIEKLPTKADQRWSQWQTGSRSFAIVFRKDQPWAYGFGYKQLDSDRSGEIITPFDEISRFADKPPHLSGEFVAGRYFP